MAAVDMPTLGRTMGNWYTATPPLARTYTGLGPCDYFGRTMVAHLPADHRVGIINVSVAGASIQLFDKDNYQSYVATSPDWMKGIINDYGGNPYQRLVDMAELAQQQGVIKGILMHQGESNAGDQTWPTKVKGVYDNLLADLNLEATSVPLLAGELLYQNQGGGGQWMNPIINTLPQTIPTAHVISADGCTGAGDGGHFNAAGYRELGRRYAQTMLTLVPEPTSATMLLMAAGGLLARRRFRG
jgi:alpha-L-fucosidase 2